MDGLITPGPESLPPPPPPPPEKKRFILGCLGVGLGLFLAFFHAWAWSYGVMGAEAWGYAGGVALAPALFAYLIAGRKSVRNFNRFGIWFSGMSVVFFLVSNTHPVSLHQHIGDLMKEAAGTKAVDHSGPAALNDLIRDMMKGILDDRKAFEKETQPMAADLGKLYSAESFSSREAMQRTLDAMHAIVAADQSYSKQLEGIPDRMQANVDRSSLSDSDKKGFMEGLRRSYGNGKALQIRRQAMEIETQWEGATVDLYEFAKTNASKIRVERTKLIIGDEGIRNKFNERFRKARKLRNDLAAMNTQLESAQKAALQDAGVTPKDLGLGEKEQPEKK
jgi:hypothetical protein